MSIFALLRRLERITRPAPSLAHDYDLPVQDVDDEVWAPTVPSRESLLDAWFYAKTPEVEKQAKDELDRYYPNFAGAAASLADGDSPHGVFCNPSVREDKQHGMRRDTQPGRADPHTTWHGDCFDHCVGHPETPQPSPVTTRTSAGDRSAAAGILPPTAAAEPLTWLGWAVPAILDVLAEHQPSAGEDGYVWCYHDETGDFERFDDWGEWGEDVAPLIAERIACDTARAVAALENFQPK